MQNNNSSDVSHFDLTVNAIKKQKSVKKKLNFFVRSIPVFFWQSKIASEILGPLGFIGFLKLSEIYRLRDKEAKTMQEYNCYNTLKSFIEKLELSESEYAPFITVIQNENMKIKRKIIKKSSPSLNTFHRLLDDNKNTKVKLSDFSGSSKYDIVSGLYNLIADGIIENIRELKKYCDKDLDPMLVYVSLILAQGTMNLNKNVLGSGNEDAKIKLSDFDGLKKYQIADGIYDLVDLGLFDGLKDINEICDNDLVRAFCVGLFSLFVNPDLSSRPDRFKSNYNGTTKKFDMQNKLFKILNEFFGDIKDGKTAELKLSDIDNPKDATIGYRLKDRIYCLIVCGIIKKYRELKKCFNKEFYQFFNSISVKLICYDLELRFENKSRNNNDDKLLPSFGFRFSNGTITKLFEKYIRNVYPNVADYYFSGFNSEKSKLKLKFGFNETEHNEALILDRTSVFRYLALFVANKNNLTKDEKRGYRQLFYHYMEIYEEGMIVNLEKSNPNYESLFDLAISELDYKCLNDRKLFMLFCAMGIFGFSMREPLKEFLRDFKLNKKQVANAFITVFKSNREGYDFINLYNSLQAEYSPVICSVKNLGTGLFEPFIYALIKSFNFSEIEDILSFRSSRELLSCRTGIRLAASLILNGLLINEIHDKEEILNYNDYEKIKSILMLIKIRRLVEPNGISQKFIIYTMFDKKGEKLNDEFKRIFDFSFENCIMSKDVRVHDLYKIVYYSEIIGLTDKQFLCINNKVLEFINNGVDNSDRAYMDRIIGIYEKKKKSLTNLANLINLAGNQKSDRENKICEKMDIEKEKLDLKSSQENQVKGKMKISIDEEKENNFSESDKDKNKKSNPDISNKDKLLKEPINEYEKSNFLFEKKMAVLNKNLENENKKYKPRICDNPLSKKRGREENNQENYSDKEK